MEFKRLSSQVVVGAVIVLVGIVLLVDTTGVYETGPLLQYVPTLFVLAGVYALLASGFRNVFGPVVVIVLAATWQLVTLDVVTGADVVAFWPVLLIVFGLSLLLGRLRPNATTVAEDRVDLLAFFGGNSQRATSDSFVSGTATALFGGAEIDLRDATVVGPPARINATALFGGVDVIVPREWNVRLDVLPIFGGAEDERPRRDPDEIHDEVDLVVTGFVAFGAITVKD